MKKKLLILFCVFALAIPVSGYFVYKNNPILIKWVMGTARNLGTPIPAAVYTDGRYDASIKVYRISKYWGGGEADSYLLKLSAFGAESRLQYIYVDLREKWVGTPACTARDCYTVVVGRLFQSETGGKFAPYDDDMKGFGFNPHLTFSNRQFSFNIPANRLPFQTIRIEY